MEISNKNADYCAILCPHCFVISFVFLTKTCEYPQIPALRKNRGYRSCGRSYTSKYPSGIKTESIKSIGGVLFLNARNTHISVCN